MKTRVLLSALVGAGLILGLTSVSNGQNPRTSTFTVPADCRVFQNRDWSRPGADPVKQNVDTVEKLVAMLRSAEGRRAMHCAGFSPGEQDVLVAAARNAVPDVIEKGSLFPIMVGGHAVFTNGRLTASSLASWVIKARTESGIELELEVAVVCGNLLPQKRTSLKQPPKKKGEIVEVVRTPHGDVIIINITINNTNSNSQNQNQNGGAAATPDLCRNIGGAQSTVPKGLVRDSKGDCVPKSVPPSPTRVGVDATLECPTGGFGTLRVQRTLGGKNIFLPIVCGQTIRAATVPVNTRVDLCFVDIPSGATFSSGSSPQCVVVRAGVDAGPRWVLISSTPTPTPQQFFTLSVSVSGSGTITGPGISCPSDCSQVLPDGGTRVTLTETPASGWQFAGWSGPCSGTGTTCAFAMDRNWSAGASFTQVSLPPTPPPGGGPVNPNP